MTHRGLCALAAVVLLAAVPVPPAHALDEPDRLWLVGERAFADGLYPLARRTLERFVQQYPGDRRAPEAALLLGKTRLTLGDPAGAVEALGRALKAMPPPGVPAEARFWEAEALFRLQRYGEARKGYEEVIKTNAAAPFAPEAFYGFGWIQLEGHKPEDAIKAFSELLKTWPEHRLAPSATFYLARALVDAKRYDDAAARLGEFVTKYKDSRLLPDAQYLLGWTRITAGDAQAGVKELRAFVNAHPNHAQVSMARRLMAEALARQGGDPQDLAEGYRTLMAQSPPTPEALNDAAGIAQRLGRANDQEAAWRKLRAQFPDHALSRRAALELANVAFKRQDWKDAAGLARAAAQSDDEVVKAEGWLLAGEAELKLKRYRDAVRAFDNVDNVPNVDPGIRYRALAGLGLAHEEQRSLQPALTAYESVATSSPDSTLRDWARQRADAVKDQLEAAKKPPPAPVKKPPAQSAPADKPPAKKPAPKS